MRAFNLVRRGYFRSRDKYGVQWLHHLIRHIRKPRATRKRHGSVFYSIEPLNTYKYGKNNIKILHP